VIEVFSERFLVPSWTGISLEMTSGLPHVLEKRDDLSSVEEERECGRSRSRGFPGSP
jgi:hypothetical protein